MPTGPPDFARHRPPLPKAVQPSMRPPSTSCSRMPLPLWLSRNVRVAGVVVGNAIDDGHVAVGVGLGVEVVEAEDVDAGVGVVGGPAPGDADVAEARPARRRRASRPRRCRTCRSPAPRRSRRGRTPSRRPPGRVLRIDTPLPLVGAPVLAFDDQIADHQAADVLAGDARAVAGADRGLAPAVRADRDRRRGRGRPFAFTTRLPSKASPPRKRSRSPGRRAWRLARATVARRGPAPSRRARRRPRR